MEERKKKKELHLMYSSSYTDAALLETEVLSVLGAKSSLKHSRVEGLDNEMGQFAGRFIDY